MFETSDPRPWALMRDGTKVAIGLALVLAVIAIVPAVSAETNAEIENRLRENFKDRILFLRTPKTGPDLHFDSEGHAENAELAPWTVAGEIAIRGIQVTDTTLEIEGERVLLRYDGTAKKFRSASPVMAIPRGIEILPARIEADEKNKAEQAKAHPVHITIQRRQGETSLQGGRDAMSRVFLRVDERISDFVPAYWRQFVSGIDGGKRETPSALPGVYKFGKDVNTTPEAISSPDPEYAEVARQYKWQGVVLLSIVVNEEGSVSNLEVFSPAGLGLDEKAVDAVSAWKFKPGMKNGEPISMQLTVEVEFHLY